MVLLVRSRQLFNFTTRHGCRYNRCYTTTATPPPPPPSSPQNKEPFSPLTKHLRDSVKVNNKNNNDSNDKKKKKKDGRIST